MAATGEDQPPELETFIVKPKKADVIHAKTKKIIQTLVQYTGFIASGMIISIVGPTVLDLQLITNSDMADMFYIFTARSLGSLVGSIMAGFLVESYNNWAVLGVIALLQSVLIVLIPRTSDIISLACVMSATGVTMGVFDTGNNVLLLRIWGEANGPWMQGLHLMFAVGCLIAPLMAEPFLAPGTTTLQTTLPDMLPISTILSATDNSSLYSAETSNSSLIRTITEPPDLQLNLNETITESMSQIWIPYSILSLLFILISFGYGMTYLIEKHAWELRNDKHQEKRKAQGIKESSTFRYKILVLISLFCFVYSALENGYMNFLSTYAVKYLGWTPSQGAQVTAAFLGSFMFGRVVGIILVQCLSPQLMLALDSVMTVASLAPMVFAAHLHPSVLWLSSISLGFSIATLFATLITWTECHITVTGPVGSTFLVASIAGDLVAPLLLAVLLKPLGLASFSYMMFGAAVIVLVIFLVMQTIATRHRKENLPPVIQEIEISLK